MAPLPYSSQVGSTSLLSQSIQSSRIKIDSIDILWCIGFAVQNPAEFTCIQTFEWLCCANRMSTRHRPISPKALTNGNLLREARPAHAFPTVETKSTPLITYWDSENQTKSLSYRNTEISAKRERKKNQQQNIRFVMVGCDISGLEWWRDLFSLVSV